MLGQAADAGVAMLLFVLIATLAVLALPIWMIIYAIVGKPAPGMKPDDPRRGFEVGPSDDSEPHQ
jgi:hypothetical protein